LDLRFRPVTAAACANGYWEPALMRYELTEDKLRTCGFFSTGLGRRLAADPVGLVDAGARWGISKEFAVGAPLFAALAFEPDPQEAERVEAKGHAENWAAFAVEPIALGQNFGPMPLNLYSRANNSSIYPVSEHAKKRYELGGFELTRVLSVPTKPLDAVAFGSNKTSRVGEVIKLDTQGAELEIIRGAKRTLQERTVCLITEAHFFPLYSGAPYFSDLDRELRELGFAFMGFSDFQNRSTKRLDKRRHWGRERVFQADAIYFRDPAAESCSATARVIDIAIFMAVLLGFFDLAIEWLGFADHLEGDAANVRAAIECISALHDGKPLKELEDLVEAARRNPALAHVITSKFVDQRRDLATFHEISLPD
jgi:FkbM family methyltransferase